MARRSGKTIIVVLVSISLCGLYHAAKVNREISPIDERYMRKIMKEEWCAEDATRLTYEQQLDCLSRVQRRVLEVASENKGIPYGTSREPKDLYDAGHGLCFDRSWVIEKIITASGLEVRHVAVYDSADTWPPWLVLLIPGVSSHAVTEVRTTKGWLVVDSNRSWISVDQDGNPIPLSTIQEIGAFNIEWEEQQADPALIFANSFISVYGLYSRHGYFFPPFVPIPDIHWGDSLYNFHD